MAHKLEIIGNSLVITDTTSNEVIAESPKQLVYFNADQLKQGNILIENIDTTNYVHGSWPAIKISDAPVDGSDTEFTAATFTTFARTNLGK